MKMDQVAYYCSNDEAERQIKNLFGLLEAAWVCDTVTATSYVRGEGPAVNVANLQFNYDLGVELELIRYTKGPNWHDPIMRHRPFISHIGIHLDDGEDFPTISSKLVQETFTISHTSHYLTKGAAAGRKYHYKIFEIAPGNFIKYIRRIHASR